MMSLCLRMSLRSSKCLKSPLRRPANNPPAPLALLTSRRPEEMGGDQIVDRRLRSRVERKEKARAGNLDHRYNHWAAPHDCARGRFPAYTRDRESIAESDRSGPA